MKAFFKSYQSAYMMTSCWYVVFLLMLSMALLVLIPKLSVPILGENKIREIAISPEKTDELINEIINNKKSIIYLEISKHQRACVESSLLNKAELNIKKSNRSLKSITSTNNMVLQSMTPLFSFSDEYVQLDIEGLGIFVNFYSSGQDFVLISFKGK